MHGQQQPNAEPGSVQRVKHWLEQIHISVMPGLSYCQRFTYQLELYGTMAPDP